MAEQPGIGRLLRLLMMLSAGYGKSISEIAELLGKTERTVYRYIETLRDFGFIITRNDKMYRVDKESPYLKDIGDLLHFTPEEAWVLNKAILALDDETYIKQSLARKLYSLYDLKGVPYPVVKRENSEKVINLIRAIENQKQVRLVGYHSSNSSTVGDRDVEPFEFTLNYGYIWCYDTLSRKNRLFKTARIGSVQMLDQSWQSEGLHKSEKTDVFRIAGSGSFQVQMLMTMRAANLLIEEYPMAEEFIRAEDDHKFTFSGGVSSFEGIGRFILGLMDEITVISPVQLKRFLNSKMEGKKF
jgi:proteasome accessory factor C